MTRHRRFDSWREWGRTARFVVLRERRSLTPAQRRRVLLQATALLALCCVLPAALMLAWSRRRDTAFDVGSPQAWERAVTRGGVAERSDRVLALGEHEMVLRVSCRVLSRLLHDSSAIRAAAVPTVAGAVRAGRCRDDVLEVLAHAPDGSAREAAALVLGSGGPAALSYAIAPLLRAVESDSAARTAAILSLATLGDSSPKVRESIVRAFRTREGEVRAEALDALERLGHPPEQLAGLARDALEDADPSMRVAAVNTLDRLGRRRSATDDDIAALVTAVSDSSPAVRRSAVDALGRVGAPSARVRAALDSMRSDARAVVRDAARDVIDHWARRPVASGRP